MASGLLAAKQPWRAREAGPRPERYNLATSRPSRNYTFPGLDPGNRSRHPMAEYSKFQQRAIKNFYDNREAIALQRAQELVTELYLTEGKKREKHWKALVGHLEKLGVKKPLLDHMVQQDNPELVANLIKNLMLKKD
jgi:hypothetical protein